MATEGRDLSHYDPARVPDGNGMRIALVVSEWNYKITDALRKGAKDTLLEHGVDPGDIPETWVPGSFELAAAAQFILERGDLDAVICLGSIVRGETPHFDFVCQGTTQGIMAVGLKFSVPVIFGVLTDDNLEQALARSGGRHGNKGVECAIAALRMVAIKRG